MHHHAILKVVLLVPLLAIIATIGDLVPKVVNDGFGAAIVLAGGLTAIAWLLRRVYRAYRYARTFVLRVHSGIDVIDTVPSWMLHVDGRLDDGDQRMTDIEAILALFATDDARRVRDALSQHEQRSITDRRADP